MSLKVCFVVACVGLCVGLCAGAGVTTPMPLRGENNANMEDAITGNSDSSGDEGGRYKRSLLDSVIKDSLPVTIGMAETVVNECNDRMGTLNEACQKLPEMTVDRRRFNVGPECDALAAIDCQCKEVERLAFELAAEGSTTSKPFQP